MSETMPGAAVFLSSFAAAGPRLRPPRLADGGVGCAHKVPRNPTAGLCLAPTDAPTSWACYTAYPCPLSTSPRLLWDAFGDVAQRPMAHCSYYPTRHLDAGCHSRLRIIRRAAAFLIPSMAERVPWAQGLPRATADPDGRRASQRTGSSGIKEGLSGYGELSPTVQGRAATGGGLH